MTENKNGFISKVKQYFNAHEDIAQLVKFTLFSMIAFAIEYISFTVIVLSLKNFNQEAAWWIFKYSTANGGLGAMIAFFISTVLAQAASFIINRKKTFKATNNLLFSIVSYSVMVCGIIILNTWAGGAITNACNKIIDNLTVCQYIGKLTGSFMAFVVTFVMSKFVIMRSPKKKTEAIPEETVKVN